MYTHRTLLALFAAVLTCACAIAPEPQSEPGVDIQALSMSEFLINLQTNDQHYLTAEPDGSISTNRTELGPWERWYIKDLDGYPFESGDTVQIRRVGEDGISYFMVADVNGGGPGSILRANRTVPQSWETFIIEKPGGGPFRGGDTIYLKASSQPYYACAQQAGGVFGDGSVVVDRENPGTWESFTLNQIQALALCPSPGSLCLWDRPNFSGESLTVQASDPAVGSCIDLAAQGWGGRARSAINWNSKSASLTPNADCTGEPVEIPAATLEPSLSFSPNSVFVF
ncbi:MAG TPA: peptidase inhibitor family I36 protein [Polyangiales bacterium]|nr:peptidase inhibitor family I36 protein [Polyangiales bacterium]